MNKDEDFRNASHHLLLKKSAKIEPLWSRDKIKSIHWNWLFISSLNDKICCILHDEKGDKLKTMYPYMLRTRSSSQRWIKFTPDSLKIASTSSRLTSAVSKCGGWYPFLNHSFSMISGIVMRCKGVYHMRTMHLVFIILIAKHVLKGKTTNSLGFRI